MGWAGVTIIPRVAPESADAAVARVLAGATIIEFGGADVLVYEAPGESPSGPITAAEREWMVHATEVFRSMDPLLNVEEQDERDGEDWPRALFLDHDDSAALIQIDREAATLLVPRGRQRTDEDFEWWWRCVQHFADNEGCVIFETDDSAVVSTDMSASEARPIVGWF